MVHNAHNPHVPSPFWRCDHSHWRTTSDATVLVAQSQVGRILWPLHSLAGEKVLWPTLQAGIDAPQPVRLASPAFPSTNRPQICKPWSLLKKQATRRWCRCGRAYWWQLQMA
jgi:hypothetical protein